MASLEQRRAPAIGAYHTNVRTNGVTTTAATRAARSVHPIFEHF
jgi:hypothetical protein